MAFIRTPSAEQTLQKSHLNALCLLQKKPHLTSITLNETLLITAFMTSDVKLMLQYENI